MRASTFWRLSGAVALEWLSVVAGAMQDMGWSTIAKPCLSPSSKYCLSGSSFSSSSHVEMLRAMEDGVAGWGSSGFLELGLPHHRGGSLGDQHCSM